MAKPTVEHPTVMDCRSEAGKGVLGYRLKKARIDRCMNLVDLSVRSGINVSTITGFENRQVLPRLPTLIALAMVLDCSLDYLVGLEDEDGKREDRPLRKEP